VTVLRSTGTYGGLNLAKEHEPFAYQSDVGLEAVDVSLELSQRLLFAIDIRKRLSFLDKLLRFRYSKGSLANAYCKGMALAGHARLALSCTFPGRSRDSKADDLRDYHEQWRRVLRSI
jgi:hypothetical protein